MSYSLTRSKLCPSELGCRVSDEASGSSRLITDGGAVIARIGGAATFAGLGIDANGVDQSDVPLAFHGVAALFHLLFHFRRKQLLHQHLVRQPLVVETGGVDGRLCV